MNGLDFNNLSELNQKELVSNQGGVIPIWGRALISGAIAYLGRREAHAPGLPKEQELPPVDLSPQLTPCDAV